MNTLTLDTFRNSLARMPALAALALVMAAGGAAAAEPAAQPFGWHPAMAARPAVAGIDPNTFIVGHPASPTVRGGHANFEHPAVIVARRAGEAGVDANTFIVQPPVSVTWTVMPEADTRLAALRR